MEVLFRELFIENYSKNKIDFIPRHYLVNPLYPECDIDTDGELIEDESEYTNYCHCSYDYDISDVYDGYRSILEIMDVEDINTVISYTLTMLNEREQIVIRMRFGLNDTNSEYTLDEIAKELRVSRERTRQIESCAVKKLKHPKVSRILKTYHDTNYDDEGRFNRAFIHTKEDVHTRFMFIADYIVKYYINKNNNELLDNDYTYEHMEKNNLIFIPDSKIELFKNEFTKLLLTQSNVLRYIEIDSNLHNNIIYKALRNIGIHHTYFIPEDMLIKINLKDFLINAVISLNNVDYILYHNGNLEPLDFR